MIGWPTRTASTRHRQADGRHRPSRPLFEADAPGASTSRSSTSRGARAPPATDPRRSRWSRPTRHASTTCRPVRLREAGPAPGPRTCSSRRTRPSRTSGRATSWRTRRRGCRTTRTRPPTCPRTPASASSTGTPSCSRTGASSP